MDWLKKEWDLQWPLVRFEFYKWAGIVLFSALIAVAAKILHGILHIPDAYLYPSLGVLCLILLFAITRNFKYGEGRERTTRQGLEKNEANDTTQISTANDVDQFYRTYDNRLLAETEGLIWQEARKYPTGNDRERFLVRLFCSTIISAMFERLWLLIYRSQVLALQALNANPAEVEQLRLFYDTVAAGTPVHSAGYPFTSWLAFMKDQVLVGEEGTRIRITVRGEEFLKYLIETHRHPDQLSN